MILLIDNYDSFTYNLAQALGMLGEELVVMRNDTLTVGDIRAMRPKAIVISPGPGTPYDAGISLDVIRHLHTEFPILGVCLGHQCLAEAFGGRVDRAGRRMHGKTSLVYYQPHPLFEGMPNPFEAMRYHSLVVYDPVPEPLEVLARTEEGEIMALAHREYPVFGVQFHPESILTQEGLRLLRNFLAVGRQQTAGSGPLTADR